LSQRRFAFFNGLKGGCVSDLRKKAVEGIKAGDMFRVTRTFTEEDARIFGDISRDYNPVHYDRRFSDTKKFKGRICHGLLVAGLVTEIGGQLGILASGMTFRYKKPVYFNDTIECRVTVEHIDHRGRMEAKVVYTNQDGERVIDGTLSGLIPGIEERRVLAVMLSEGDPTNGIRE